MILRVVVVVMIATQLSLDMRRPPDSVVAASVLVGAAAGSSGTTFGTGFLVQRQRQIYVVTCRHVIEESGATSLFAVPRPQKNKRINPLRLGSPRFHPSDSQQGTYDIAVLEVLGVSPETLASIGVKPIEIATGRVPAIRTKIIVSGFPAEYAERELKRDTQEPMLPIQVQGTLSKLSLDTLPRVGFSASLREVHFAETVEPSLGKGASGGVVYVVHRDGTLRVIGVLLASVDAQLVEEGRPRAVRGAVFASVERIRETLR